MTQPLQIFMEYKVSEEKVEAYERAMESIIEALPDYGASRIQWYVAEDQPHLYVEMYEVPTSSHYHALKKLRKSHEHTLFSQIIPYIEGGSEKIHFWAFQRKN
ncbi:hypothetical protein [Halalkalibacter nanhaiisediminis]|uniref:Quinol monooxygenase YgiN n=1 Tax=Halalkalibacter nanhaiisediminis TaxID=688079 RepID=A0A562Q805_9BACI|nr:hypothetical protein [Halalkalibacter nanhaiisediminis]TWI52882.1 hypothetical protein IQ10_03577 [Halalkalibacter nanhaiisediminis]